MSMKRVLLSAILALSVSWSFAKSTYIPTYNNKIILIEDGQMNTLENQRQLLQLDSKDIRQIIARFLGIPLEDVIPNRYNFSVVGLSPEEIEKKLDRNAPCWCHSGKKYKACHLAFDERIAEFRRHAARRDGVWPPTPSHLRATGPCVAQFLSRHLDGVVGEFQRLINDHAHKS